MQNVQVQDFGGLDLSDDPPEVNGAIDMLNVDLSQRGRIATRPGAAVLCSTLASGGGGFGYVAPAVFAGQETLAELSTNATNVYLDKVSGGGTLTAIGNWAGKVIQPFARIGTPTTETIYIPSCADVATGNLVRKYDGTTLGTFASKPIFVGVLPASNRMVHAGFFAAADSPSGANGTRSTVFFSDPGAPETFGANNYVHLQPGDGEVIQALVTWRDQLFVFKRSTLFIFTATSVDTTGNPVFNYRTVTLADPLADWSRLSFGVTPQFAVAGSDGVYFVARNGVCRTVGDQPQLISSAVTPIFKATATIAANISAPIPASMSWVDSRLFIRYAESSQQLDRMLVWDQVTGVWMLWGVAKNLAGGAPVRFGNVLAFWFGGYVYSFSSASTGDPDFSGGVTTALASYYQSGWTDLGTPNDKRIREIAAWGSGTPTLSLFKDRGSTDTLAAAVTLGTAPAVVRGVQRKARTGRELSWKVSATSGAWNVSSLELLIADQRGN